MYNGFPATNTPAIQVWNFFNTFANTAATRSVSLPDDCAPIQFFKTGGSTTNIFVQLPSAPIEGKAIKIIVNKYGTENQKIVITTPDASGSGSALSIWVIGPGQTLELCYSKECISVGPALGSPYSTGWIALNQGSASSGNYSAINFGHNNVATSNYASSIGGAGNSATANYAGTFGGNNSTASGSRSSVVGGDTSTASGTNSAVIGGSNSSVGQLNGATLGGNSHQVSNLNAVVCGGTASVANGSGSIILGGSYGWARGISGNTILPASEGPIEAGFGKQQLATLLIGRQTTDATVTTLASNNSAASTTNQLVLPNNSAYYVRGSCIANVSGAGNTKAWSFEVAIKRGASAATTAIVGAVIKNIVAADAGAATWDITIDADTTNGCLRVRATGQASTTIRWVCRLDSTEVTY